MLQLYGNSRSRAMRCLWMLEEMGKPYQLIEKSTRADDLQGAEYLRLNPNARIPTLVDGDLVLWESMAINLYLAQKYEGPMHCPGPEVLGLAAQWSFWIMLETEALLLDLLQHRAVLPRICARRFICRTRRIVAKKATRRAQWCLGRARLFGGK
jgi:glutathione S-transferase